MYRQGDVLLIPVAALPKGCRPIPAEGERIILARGEVTGHAHAVIGGAEYFRSSRRLQRFLVVGGNGALLRHEEHAPIDLPAGVYEVRRQRELEDWVID